MGLNFVRASRWMLFSGVLKRGFGISAMLLAMTVISAQAHAAELLTHWTMPIIAVPEADRPYGPNVFGTIALPVRPKPMSTRWAKLMLASLDEPALVRLTADAQKLPSQEQAAFVQSVVNHAVGTNPLSNGCSDSGYWAAAAETLARGMGNCFNIAITKMEALRLLGIPAKDLYLTTGYYRTGLESGRGHESVALLVRIGEGFWLLPEQSEQIIEAGSPTVSSTEFTPILTYGVGMTWVHGQVVKIASLGN